MTRTRSWTRYLVLLPVAAVLIAAAPMHLRLTESSPAEDAELAVPPTSIQLWFSLPPEIPVSRLDLTCAGDAVELEALEAGEDNSIVAAVVGPVRAECAVSWRTSSGDGHPIRGEYGFTVAATE